MSEEFDVVVVGAGVIGSSTAYHLASSTARTKKILLVEQYPVLHTKGSSHGGSRITRRAYVQPHFVRMMEEAILLWKNLEEESGERLYTPTGILVFGDEETMRMQSVIANLKSNKATFEVFSGEEGNRRYPDQLNLPPNYVCVLERDGGILTPPKVLTAFQNLFIQRGGVLWDSCPVTEIIPGESIKLVTSKGCILAKKVVLTVGSWAPVWTKNLGINFPMKISKSGVYYWKVTHPENFVPIKFPVFIHYVTESESYYGIPIHENQEMMKIAYGGPEFANDDNRSAMAEYGEKISSFIAKHFKGVSTDSSIYELCQTTWIAKENPIIDRHPSHSNIIMGVGMSGHGFKLSPVIGKILCELALDLKVSYDLTPFKINR